MEPAAIIGNVNLDVVVKGPSTLPPPGTEWLVESVDARVGGAAANAALTLAGLGRRPLVVGSVGDDLCGKLLRDELLRAGVASLLSTIAGASTGVSVAVEGGERDRSFFTSLGALEAFEASMIPGEVTRRRFVLVCGYFLVPRLRGAVTRDLFEAVQKHGGTTLLDTGWDPGDWQQETRSEIVEILPVTDVFLPNESEAFALADEHEPETAARALHRLSGGAVVVKLGPRGALAITPRGDLLRVSAPMVESRDTTGAGDAFNAGLMNALEAGLDWHVALSTATVVASTVVGNPSRARFQLPPSLLSNGASSDHG